MECSKDQLLYLANDCFSSNTLELNIEKTQFLNFFFGNNNNKNGAKLLGVHLDMDLNWFREIFLLRQLEYATEFYICHILDLFIAIYHTVPYCVATRVIRIRYSKCRKN